MTIIDCSSQDPFATLKSRGIRRDAETERIVAEIIEDVRTRGDEALLDNARKFDAPELTTLSTSQVELEAASISPDHLKGIRTAIERIESFHERQFSILTTSWQSFEICERHDRKGWVDEDQDGFLWQTAKAKFHEFDWPGKVVEGSLGQRLMPLSSAGVYVPGGEAAYPSSVLMNAIPANTAKVDRLVCSTPARRDGTLHPAVLVACREVGAREVFKIGGAAAIAAMALGTESVPQVDKIVGPGNRFVNEAKRQLWGTVGLDGYAGPSEVCVLADDEANARFAAADLITQVEHAEDNAAFLVTLSKAKAEEILAEVEKLLEPHWERRPQVGNPDADETSAIPGGRSPSEVARDRASTIRKALAANGMTFIARDMEQACDIVNAIAPEHLTIATKQPEKMMERIRNAGCILLGEYTPESAGDFCLGPSHTLPTAGAARFGSPVNVLDFLKVQSVARLTKDQLSDLLPTIEAFGGMEGFPFHARGASIRFED